MTVCECCNQLFNGLARYCPDCEREWEEQDQNDDCHRCKGIGHTEDNSTCWVCKGSGVQT